MNFAKNQTSYDACMYNDEYESFTMFALDLERGMFCSHLKKKTNFDLLSFAMFKDSNDYLNLKYK